MKYQQNGAGGNESKKDSSSSNWWVWLLVGIAALLCVGGVAAGLFVARKNRNGVSFQDFGTELSTEERINYSMSQELNQTEFVAL